MLRPTPIDHGEPIEMTERILRHRLRPTKAALQQRRSAYAGVPGALLELAGETAQPVKPAAEELLDESWAEPPVFDRCSTKGQARPGQPQPVRLVRADTKPGAVA